MKLRLLYISGILFAALIGPFVPWYYFALFLLFLISILVLACINLSWNFFIRVFCRAYTTEKIIVFSFDDGPAEFTSQILDTLQEHSVPATFFCIGKNISGNEQILTRIHKEGHIIGNHSYAHHFWYDLWSAAKIMADMREMDNRVKATIGLTPHLFRPPYGVINPNVAAAIKGRKYIPIGWSVRSLDTRIKEPQKLLARIMKKVAPGGIILLHDSMEITAQILPQLISELKNQGYTITSLDKMLNIAAYA